MTSTAWTSKTTAKNKRLAWEDVAKQVALQTSIYCSSEYSFICLMFSLVRIMLLYGCSFLRFFRLGINYRSIVSAERLSEEKKSKLRLAEAYDSASFEPIHTRSELSSDSDSAYDSASVASVVSVNQP